MNTECQECDAAVTCSVRLLDSIKSVSRGFLSVHTNSVKLLSLIIAAQALECFSDFSLDPGLQDCLILMIN